jgi:UrcA family protein
MNSAIVKGYALAAVALTAVLTAHAAWAAPEDSGPRTAVVRYSDLDLSQSHDVKRLYERIKSAAQEVCDNNPGSDLRRLTIYKSCIRDAVSNAVSQLRSTNIRQAELQRMFGG